MTDPEPTTPQQPEKPNADGGGDGQGQPAPPVTFSQEQVDTIVKDRLARATTKTQADLLAELDIEDVATAKKTLADAKTAQAAQMSELEKAQAEIAEAQEATRKATAEAETIKVAASEALLKAAIISQAGHLNDSMDAWQFIDRSKIEVQEDGSYKGIDEALKALAETKPYLVKAENGNHGPGTPARPKPKSIVEKIFEDKQQSDQPRRSTITF